MFGLFRPRKEHARRGYGRCTRTCVHLKEGADLGWFVSPDAADDDHWPLAWCKACNEIVEAAGGIARATTALRLSSFCDVCYERQRDQNWPSDTTFRRSGVLGPWKTDLEVRNRALAAHHNLARYDWNDWQPLPDASPLLVLRKRATGERVALTVQILGTFSTRTETWLWSWGQPEAAERETGRLREIRAYGREQGSLKIACAHWAATEKDVFEMTAVAASFIPCLGEYRLPYARGYSVFLVLSAVEIEPVEPSPAFFS
jgi:hypothetical protein